MFVPEHAAEGFQLAPLIEDLGCLEPFGLSGATITECKLYVFVILVVGSESAKFAGTSIGQLQLMSDILGMCRVQGNTHSHGCTRGLRRSQNGVLEFSAKWDMERALSAVCEHSTERGQPAEYNKGAKGNT